MLAGSCIIGNNDGNVKYFLNTVRGPMWAVADRECLHLYACVYAPWVVDSFHCILVRRYRVAAWVVYMDATHSAATAWQRVEKQR